jgi:hypothetical protein
MEIPHFRGCEYPIFHQKFHPYTTLKGVFISPLSVVNSTLMDVFVGTNSLTKSWKFTTNER